MRTALQALPILALLAAHVSPCAGQESRPTGYVTGFKLGPRIFEKSLDCLWHPLTVVQLDAVQTELKLDDDRRRQVQELLNEASGALVLTAAEQQNAQGRKLLRREVLEKQAARVPALVAEFGPRLNELLTDPQRRRLDEIVLQAQGGEALARMDVAEALKLTTEQREQITSTKKKHAEAVSEISKVRAQDPEESRRRSNSLLVLEQRRHSDLFAVLSAEQSRRFRELQGPQVDTSWFNLSDMYGTSLAPPPPPRLLN